MSDQTALVAAEKARLVQTVSTSGWSIVLRILNDCIEATEKEVRDSRSASVEQRHALMERLIAAKDIQEDFLRRIDAHQYVEADSEFRPVTII